MIEFCTLKSVCFTTKAYGLLYHSVPLMGPFEAETPPVWIGNPTGLAAVLAKHHCVEQNSLGKACQRLGSLCVAASMCKAPAGLHESKLVENYEIIYLYIYI